MAARHCNGSDPELVGRDSSPYCSCGAQFDDAQRGLTWPHLLLPPLAEISAIVRRLRALDAPRRVAAEAVETVETAEGLL